MVHKRIGWLLALILALAGCSQSRLGPEAPQVRAYGATPPGGTMAARHAPIFVAEGAHLAHNRIGRPSAERAPDGRERVFVDPDRPVFYQSVHPFETLRGSYTNLVYRVHFAAIPHGLVPFHLSAGRNVGVLVVITLDRAERPVLVTVVQTCGCYVASVPTSHLPADALPPGWSDAPQHVYGETLPGRLTCDPSRSERLVVHLRADTHRVRQLEVAPAGCWPALLPAVLAPAAELERLPLGDGATTSFYHDHWPLRGHVKGSVKIWESLFMSLMAWDFFVGTDKVYGDRRQTGNPFYTSLQPWFRNASDMGDFVGFLRFYGWRL